jgi:probable HAF family extracellular repeat protein
MRLATIIRAWMHHRFVPGEVAILRRFVLAAVLAVGLVSEAKAGYMVVDLGTLQGGNQSQGYAVGGNGGVTGFATTSTGLEHAFMASALGSMSDLGTLSGGNFSQGYAINATGSITGLSDVNVHGRLETHAFISSGAGMQDLGTLPGDHYSAGYAINTKGEVAGGADAGGGNLHAFISSGGSLHDLGTLGGATSQANGINDAGIVTGWAQTSFGAIHAFRTDALGHLSDLGTLGSDASSYGNAINGLGQVAGYSASFDGTSFHAFVTDVAGNLHALGSMGGTATLAYGINISGSVVGESDLGGSAHAVLWAPNGTPFDLNQFVNPASGWVLESARGINDLGQITGYGTLTFESTAGLITQTHAFLMVPTQPVDPGSPEPASIFLLALGALGLAARNRLTGSRRR